VKVSVNLPARRQQVHRHLVALYCRLKRLDKLLHKHLFNPQSQPNHRPEQFIHLVQILAEQVTRNKGLHNRLCRMFFCRIFVRTEDKARGLAVEGKMIQA
jgi:hypothetical protein